VGCRDPLLLRSGIEDGRPVLASVVVALAVELGWVVGDGEENLQQLPEADALRVVANAQRLGVVGGAAADGLVVRGVCRSAGVARRGLEHAVQQLAHGLRTPETAAGDHEGLLAGLLEVARGIGEVVVAGRHWSLHPARPPDSVNQPEKARTWQRRPGYWRVSRG